MYLLAETVTVGQFPKMEIGGNLMIVIVVLAVIIFRYLVSRMRHKQIMAAIEKGLPISDLKISTWKGLNAATSIALAPAMFIVAAGLAYMFYLNQRDTGALLGIFIASALGTFFLIRGILRRKAEKALLSEKSDNRVG